LLLPLEYVGKCAPSGRWLEFEEHVSSKFAECGTMLQKGLVTLLVWHTPCPSRDAVVRYTFPTWFGLRTSIVELKASSINQTHSLL